MSITLSGTTGINTPDITSTAAPSLVGTNFTSLPSASLTGALPVINGSNLTNLTSANLTGALPAIDGSSLTGMLSGYSAKALVNFNGTGTVAINADENVSSITDQGTGAYFVNMTSAVTDANYVFTGLSKTPSSGNGRGRIEPNLSTQTSSGFGLWTGAIHNIISVSDSPLVMAAVIR